MAATSPQRQTTAVGIRDALATLLVAAVVALIIRTFLVGTYVVSGVSMLPTFLNGEHVIVNKLAFLLGPPRDGEIIVFHPPVAHDTVPFIKRVIATPGQIVSIRQGALYVDGRAVPQPYIEYWDPRSFYATHPITVPAGDVFVLGDNRPVSYDSRFFGMVPEHSIIGQVVFAFWPFGRLGAVGQAEPGARGYPS